ncbi:MAG: hypothetical protein ACK40M_09130 [Flavobacteriales bacterium]
MTIAELFKQASQLTPDERKTLAVMLVESLDTSPAPVSSEGHWGREVVALVEAMDSAAWQASGPEDPVEWVKHIRHETEKRLKAYWNDEP